MTVDYKLRPQKAIYKQVYVFDASDSRVNQWLDVENANGLVDLEMPLSQEPNMGKWRIEVRDASDDDDNDDDKSIRKSVSKAFFEVKKYVLPKFEVLINHKKKISSSDENVLVTVCGK